MGILADKAELSVSEGEGGAGDGALAAGQQSSAGEEEAVFGIGGKGVDLNGVLPGMDFDETAGHVEAVGMDAVFGSAVDDKSHAAMDADVVVAGNGMLVLSRHVQGAVAVEDNLTFAEDGALVILTRHSVRVDGGIAKRIGRAVGEVQEHTLLVVAYLLHIDDGARSAGQRHVVERYHTLLDAVETQ